MRLTGRGLLLPGVVAFTVGVAVACGAADPGPEGFVRRLDGDPGRGRQAATDAGCGSCHRIPGVPNAESLVGPPLDGWAERSFIAGTLANSPENLARWLTDPQAVEPGTAMPSLALDEGEVADIVAYLFSLSD